ncbi:hypothetical protein EXIGLDRAFT_835762 [Exidia glandulosa HHB12029]|uniref:Uncharacterized protein n=1 Tax=Exidia glandulosa HHB12029 TaxID=1314781 RepID=A0A165IFT7_EXIGL|nr:hypothetical protein EXIGLDRAFT_835762 [Exidia glandulosa HHB12029]
MSDAKQTQKARKELEQFIQKTPNSLFTFDSERGAPVSEICRQLQPDARRECMRVQLHATALFAAMQDLGFYCHLPQDPGATHMECKPLPKELK